MKRVIGVAGDTIHCCDKQGRISVNGQPLDEGAYIKRRRHGLQRADDHTCNWTAGPVPTGTCS